MSNGNRRRKGIPVCDRSLLFVVLFLCLFGLVMIYSTSSDRSYMLKQAKFLLAGFAVMLVLSYIPMSFFRKMSIPSYAVAVLMMLLTDFTKLGQDSHGQQRWLSIPHLFRFQPAELVKIAVILTAAYVLVRWRKSVDRWAFFFIFLAVVGLPCGLVLIHNLSSGIVIAAIPMVMLFIVSRNKKRALIVVGLGVGLVAAALLFGDKLVEIGVLKPYQWVRIYVWQDPEAYASSGGYQVLQGLYAIGSGGLFGKGLGGSMQKLGSIPEASNDMIFSIICEELGLFGAICLILLYLFLLYRLVIIAQKAADIFSSFVVVGIFAHVALQVVLHIAVVSNAIPNTGITLPFISYGGTAVLVLMGEMGLALGVSRQAAEAEANEF